MTGREYQLDSLVLSIEKLIESDQNLQSFFTENSTSPHKIRDKVQSLVEEIGEKHFIFLNKKEMSAIAGDLTKRVVEAIILEYRKSLRRRK